MTFSAPKSVSVLWAMSAPETRTKIESAHHAAVECAASFLEEKAGITRRGAGGKTWEKAKLVFALFQHGTSRACDPQLHTHTLLINLCVREDGTTGTIRSKGFFENKIAAGKIYQLALAHQLRNELNLSISQDKFGCRVEGVSREVCRFFSKRRQEIEKVLQRDGDHSAKHSERVAIRTRPSKQEMPASELFAEWQRQGEKHGWGPNEARKLFKQAGKKQRTEGKIRPDSAEERMIEMLKAAEDKNAKDNPFDRREKHGQKKPYFTIESRFLFPRAPEWSPFKNWRIPILISGDKKSKDWWGKVRWKMETPLGQLQFRNKLVFPNAPEWSPIKHLAVPRLVLRQNTEWKWREVLWKKNTAHGQLQLRRKRIFPHAAEGSFTHKLSIPAFRLQTKRPEYNHREVNQQKHSY
jgi:conjugative relaxase-like TrwC/TraI family protein